MQELVSEVKRLDESLTFEYQFYVFSFWGADSCVCSSPTDTFRRYKGFLRQALQTRPYEVVRFWIPAFAGMTLAGWSGRLHLSLL